MTRLSIRVLATAFAASTGFAVLPAWSQVTIGASAPLTGPRAQLGRYYKQGVELALAEINEAGGVLGKPLAVAFEDDQGDNPNTAMNAVNRLMQVDKVPVFPGAPLLGGADGHAESLLRRQHRLGHRRQRCAGHRRRLQVRGAHPRQ